MACSVKLSDIPLTDESQTLLHSLVGFDLIALVLKLNKWDESALFFDGSSLGAYLRPTAFTYTSLNPRMAGLFMAAVVLYLSAILPGIKTIVNPLPTETEAERIETSASSESGTPWRSCASSRAFQAGSVFPFLLCL